MNTITAVMKLAQDNKLQFYKYQCQLILGSIQIYRYILRDQGVETDSHEIDTSLKIPTPAHERILRRLLAMAHYLWQFYQQLTSVVAPLSERQVATKH